MNIDKINNVLGKAINHFQTARLEAMDEMIDGLIEDDEGSDVLNGFVDKVVAEATGQVEATDDEIIDSMFEIAEAAAESGKLPDVPDGEDEEEWTEWVDSANEAGLADATVSLIQKRAAA